MCVPATSVAVAAAMLLCGICSCVFDTDVDMGNCLLMLEILHVWTHTHVQSNMIPGMD